MTRLPPFSIATWNCNGLSTDRIHQIDSIPRHHRPSILALVETHLLSPSDPSGTSGAPPTFAAFPRTHHAHSTRYRSAGVSLLLGEHVTSRIAPRTRHPPSPFALFIHSSLPTPSGMVDCTIGAVYVRHDADGSSWEFIRASIRRAVRAARRSNSVVVICGDFNAHHPRWGGDHSGTDARGTQLAGLLDDLDLAVMNADYCRGMPTYHRTDRTANGSTVTRRSTLDLILTTHPELFESLQVNPPSLALTSDHSPLLLSTISPFPRAPLPPPRWRWAVERADWDEYRVRLNEQVRAVIPTVRRLLHDPHNQQAPSTVVETLFAITIQCAERAAEGIVPYVQMGDGRGRHKWWWSIDPDLPLHKREYRAARQRLARPSLPLH
jgi:retrotransposon-encoded endonuclease